MISCRVSRREYKAQQGRLPASVPSACSTTAAEAPLPSRLFLAAERVGAWQTWREERVASSCFARRAARPAPPKALLRLVTCRDVGGTEVEKSSMPRQTPRMMAQRAMAYDWPHLRLVGFCLEAYSSLECRWWKCRWGFKIDTCHMSWRCLWYSISGSD